MANAIDWVKVKAERAGGTTVDELAKRYGVSRASIYLHMKAPKSKNGTGKARVITKASTLPKGDFDAAGMLLVAETQRDKLNNLIAALRDFMGLN